MHHRIILISAFLAASSCFAQETPYTVMNWADDLTEPQHQPLPDTDSIFSNERQVFGTAQSTQRQAHMPAWERPYTSSAAFDSTATGSGWLGKRLVSVQAGYGWTGGSLFSEVTSRGRTNLQTSINVPAPWSDDLFTTLSHDLFMSGGWAANDVMYLTTLTGSYTNGGTGGSQQMVMRFAEEESRRTWATNVGTTIYVSTWRSTRPFLQLGYGYRRYSEYFFKGLVADSTVGGGGAIVPEIRAEYQKGYRNEHRLLTNIGFERDISDTLAFRAQSNLNTRTGIDDSSIAADFIYWPMNRCFVSLGYFEDFSNRFAGLALGAGVRF